MGDINSGYRPPPNQYNIGSDPNLTPTEGMGSVVPTSPMQGQQSVVLVAGAEQYDPAIDSEGLGQPPLDKPVTKAAAMGVLEDLQSDAITLLRMLDTGNKKAIMDLISEMSDKIAALQQQLGETQAVLDDKQLESMKASLNAAIEADAMKGKDVFTKWVLPIAISVITNGASCAANLASGNIGAACLDLALMAAEIGVTVAYNLGAIDESTKEKLDYALMAAGFACGVGGALRAAMKAGVKALAKQAAKQAVKEASKEISQTAAKQAAGEISQVAARQAVKETTETAMKEAGEKAAKQAVADMGDKVYKEASDKAIKELGKEASQEAVQEAGEKAGKAAVEKLQREAAEEAMKQVKNQMRNEVKAQFKHLGKEAVENALKGVDSAGNEAFERSAKETMASVSQDAIDQAAKDASNKAWNKVIADAGGITEASEQAAKEAGEKAAKEAAESFVTEAGQRAGDEALEQAAKEAAEKATAEAIANGSSKKAAAKAGKEAAQQVRDNVDGFVDDVMKNINEGGANKAKKRGIKQRVKDWGTEKANDFRAFKRQKLGMQSFKEGGAAQADEVADGAMDVSKQGMANRHGDAITEASKQAQGTKSFDELGGQEIVEQATEGAAENAKAKAVAEAIQIVSTGASAAADIGMGISQIMQGKAALELAEKLEELQKLLNELKKLVTTMGNEEEMAKRVQELGQEIMESIMSASEESISTFAQEQKAEEGLAAQIA